MCQSEQFEKTIKGFQPKAGEQYHKRVELAEGIYSGYILDGKKTGPGTFVDHDGVYRMEGIWV